MTPKAKSRSPIDLKFLGLAGSVLILFLAGREIYDAGSDSGHVFADLSWKWLATFFAYLLLAIGSIVFYYRLDQFPKKKSFWQKELIKFRSGLGNLKWPLLFVAVLLPAYFVFCSSWGSLFTGLFVRLLVFAFCIGVCSFLLSKRILEWHPFLIATLAVGTALVLAESLVLVSNYPFALHWSEGNRLWDYSLRFGSSRYNHSGPILAWIDSGRQFLWGLPFLIPNLPIWAARFWNAILTTIPYALLGWAAFRSDQSKSTPWVAAGVWCMLFLNQGPIYTPLVLSAILVLLARRKPLWIALPLVLVAGHYAGLSRFTWIFAPAIWAVLLSLGDAVIDRGRLAATDYLQVIALGLAGIWSKGLPVVLGVLGSLLPSAPVTNPGVATQTPGGQGIETIQGLQAATSNQPYAWHRLLPNDVYAPGILLGIALTCLPLIFLLIYAARRGFWKTTAAQNLITLAGVFSVLIVGVIASAKVGGGTDLHNLDMFLITLVMLAALAWRSGFQKKLFNPIALPNQIRLALAAAILLPSFLPMINGKPLELPAEERTQYVLQRIQEKVACARNYGEVLFMDQRQLLTFGQMGDLPLVVDYEKKYMMDQALAGNEEYFHEFEQDLAEGRFSLIVGEREAILYKDPNDPNIGDGLIEENNAWIKWVTVPLLRHYESVANYRDAAIELFMPIDRTFDCP